MAASVRDRVQWALFEFPAEEARYHVDCKQRFECSRPLSGTADVASEKSDADAAFDYLVAEILLDRSRIWNSIELHKAYVDFDDVVHSRKSLVSKLKSHFGDQSTFW